MSPKITDEAKELRKQAILEAAKKCFAEKGYYETSIDEIVDASSMSKGAIYTYFSSKEEIFISLMDHMTESSFARIDEAFANMNTATEKLVYLIHRNFVIYQEQKVLQRVHFEFWLYSADSEKLRIVMKERNKRFDQVILNIIHEGIANGEFRKDLDVKTTASLYWPFRDGIWLHYLTIGHAEEFERSIRGFEEIYFKHLRGF